MFNAYEPKFEIMPGSFDYIIEGDSKGYDEKWFGKGSSI